MPDSISIATSLKKNSWEFPANQQAGQRIQSFSLFFFFPKLKNVPLRILWLQSYSYLYISEDWMLPHLSFSSVKVHKCKNCLWRRQVRRERFANDGRDKFKNAKPSYRHVEGREDKGGRTPSKVRLSTNEKEDERSFILLSREKGSALAPTPGQQLDQTHKYKIHMNRCRWWWWLMMRNEAANR